MAEKIQKIYLDDIEVKDHQHRMDLDIDALVESIEAVGQINPITVKKVGNRFRVIAGRRRFASLKRIQKATGKPQTAMAIVKDISEIQEEIIFIDENLMRQELTEVEYDEALFRRKQLYEQLHPETKKSVAGGLARHKSEKVSRPTFAVDSAKKLKVSRRTVEKAIARASRASELVKKARERKDLTPSQVDLLVGLPASEQDVLLAVVKTQDLAETRELVKKATKHGAKAALLYLEDEAKEDPALKPLVRDASRLGLSLYEATKAERILRGKNRYENVKMLEDLQKRLEKFLAFQRSHMGFVRAIRRTKDGDRRVIRA